MWNKEIRGFSSGLKRPRMSRSASANVQVGVRECPGRLLPVQVSPGKAPFPGIVRIRLEVDDALVGELPNGPVGILLSRSQRGSGAGRLIGAEDESSAISGAECR